MSNFTDAEMKQIEKAAKRSGTSASRFAAVMEILSPGRFNADLLSSMSETHASLGALTDKLCKSSAEKIKVVSQEVEARATQQASFNNTVPQLADRPSEAMYKEAEQAALAASTPAAPGT